MPENLPEIAIPYITSWKGYSLDIYSYMAKERILFLEETNSESARRIIAQMLHLSEANPNRDITLFINHGGGCTMSGLAIIDIMGHLKCDVATVSLGTSASMGAVILCAGKKGKRYASPNTTIMMHQGRLSEAFRGSAVDLHIQAEEFLKLEEVINNLIAKQSGQPLDKLVQDTMRDFYLDAEQARQYGLIDQIITGWPPLAQAGGIVARTI